MQPSTAKLLALLGQGVPIDEVCRTAGMTREAFLGWWRQEAARRVPPPTGNKTAPVQADVRIERDAWGIPHIFAATDDDLFFGFGFAMAQDRMFQLDYLRRRAQGRLAEVLGPEAVETDLTARIVGLPYIAQAEWLAAPQETRRLLARFTDGVNAWLEQSRASPAIEFSLLEYEPEPWSPVDCLAIAGEFRWYLTGRLHVIAIPELARRTLGAGPLYEAFLQGEADSESILSPADYPRTRSGTGLVGVATNDPQQSQGSNNWVISGMRTTSGMPLVASDPHIAFGAVSCWYEVRLTGGSFDVVGMAYVGMPAVMFGRTRHVAWGLTNNICSLRDLYQERADLAHPGCFLYKDEWVPARKRQEVIRVRGEADVVHEVVVSHNGPIVDAILPPAARHTGPVSLRWLGAYPCGWMTALLAMDRASTGAELADATRPWRVPTFSLVFADDKGHIGYQCTGRIPIRNVAERGYRPGWDPAHQWEGLISFEGMPRVADPEQGFVVTANNRVAPDDFPYPLSGTWSSGHRARRIRQMIQEVPRLSREDCGRMQQDVRSLRAVECLEPLIALLRSCDDPRVPEALHHLENWDCEVQAESIGAALFNVFFWQWCRTVAHERFEEGAAEFMATAAWGLAAALLHNDACGWFHRRSRQQAVQQAFVAALDELTARLGPDIRQWHWGRLHLLQQRHFLSGRGSMEELLDRGNVPVQGDGYTVCNTGFDPSHAALLGAGYRLLADLADPNCGLWAVDAGSASGHPGSPHYDDQLETWLAGGYHYHSLAERSAGQAAATWLLHPSQRE